MSSRRSVEKTTNMIPVRMRQDDFVHARQVDIQFLRILQHCVRPSACVDEHTVVIAFDKNGETPLADAAWFAHQHRRENSDREILE